MLLYVREYELENIKEVMTCLDDHVSYAVTQLDCYALSQWDFKMKHIC